MSGRKFSFEINRTSSAPAATLFRLVADGANWSKWAKPIVRHSSWARQGDPAPGGVGSIRKVGMWPLLVQEETVAYEPDHRHAYKLVGPPTPAKDYSGERYRHPLDRLVRRGRPGDGSGDAGGDGGCGPVLRGPTGEGGRARIGRRTVAITLAPRTFRNA
jgi:polyketide cyclase/dehydrase/lipid transport protein